jgi:nicotinate-nucleotide adenylyltransferase
VGVVGVFGGTFDPPHLGHLAAAQEVLERARLDLVLFVPTQQNPLKLDEPSSETDRRVAMTDLAIAGNSSFALSRADVDRPGPSFTVDLLERLQAELRGDSLALIVGMDVLHELHRWRAPERVLELAQMIAISRPGQATVDPADLETRFLGVSERVRVVETPGVAISSNELRARVAGGRPIRYLVPDAVAAYIEEHGLYRPS